MTLSLMGRNMRLIAIQVNVFPSSGANQPSDAGAVPAGSDGLCG